MSSLLESQVAAQASPAGGDVTSGAVARMADPAALPPSEIASVASGTTLKGGRRRQRRSSKRLKGRKSQRRRRSLRRPRFLL